MAALIAEIAPDVLSQALLDAALRSKLGILVTARDGDALRTVFANAVVSEQLGYDAQELRTLNIASLAVPEERAEVLRISGELRAGREVAMPFPLRARAKSGAVREFELSASLVSAGADRLMVTFLSDVTERKATERRAAALDSAFKGFMERAPDAVLVSRGGLVLWANSSAAKQLAYESAEQLRGANLFTMLEPSEAQELGRRLKGLVETGVPTPPLEYNVRRKDGALTRAEGSSVLIDWEGQPAIFSVIRDISDRARQLAQLAQTDRLVALGTLAAGVAHEINNPMAAVLFAVEGVERLVARHPLQPGAQADVLKVLGELRRAAERVTRIVKELRTFSRGGDDTVAPVDLRQVVEGAERLTGGALRDGVRLAVSLEGVPPVLGNADRLEQVVVNLLVNAAQAMPPGRPPEDNRVQVAFEVQGERVALVVRDNGAGIPPELLGRIFEPFFTTKPAGVGTGLGLSICHGLVKQLGGELQVQSAVGQGTTVRVLLRRAG